jgi:hypothetical protein
MPLSPLALVQRLQVVQGSTLDPNPRYIRRLKCDTMWT